MIQQQQDKKARTALSVTLAIQGLTWYSNIDRNKKRTGLTHTQGRSG